MTVSSGENAAFLLPLSCLFLSLADDFGGDESLPPLSPSFPFPLPRLKSIVDVFLGLCDLARRCKTESKQRIKNKV
jgi:hypothetical protein